MPGNQNIKIGPAGWSYADWRGLVYPESAGSKFDTLALVAKYLDTVEINSSFYHPPSPTTATSWLKRIAHNPAFKFTAKLYKAFTHEHRKATTDDEKMFREGIDPLREAGKLGAVLIQFPWSFKNDREERSYLTQLIERFSDWLRAPARPQLRQLVSRRRRRNGTLRLPLSTSRIGIVAASDQRGRRESKGNVCNYEQPRPRAKSGKCIRAFSRN